MTQWGLDTLFNPAKRHMDEEKRRLQSTREEIGDSSGGKRIDLESGRVTIRRESNGDADETDDESRDTAEAAGKAQAAEKGRDERSKGKQTREKSAAAERAAARRARAAKK